MRRGAVQGRAWAAAVRRFQDETHPGLARVPWRRVASRFMRLLDRYLLRELLVPLGFCLGGFFIFWIAFDLFGQLNEFEENGVGVRAIVEYYVLVSPAFLRVVLPIGLLLALLYALTRHARQNEITAMRAAGQSLWRIALPYLAVGVLAGGFLFLMNERWAPQWEARANRILKGESADARNADHVATRLGFVNARDGRSWMIDEFWIDTGTMVKPQVHWRQADGRQRSIYAESAYHTNGVWTFVDVREYLDTGEGGLPQPGLSTNLWRLPMLTETPEQIRSEVWISERLSKIGRTKEADVPLTVLLDYQRLHPRPDPEVARWLLTMLHARIAMPWTCLVVVLIALPFAGATGRKNLFVGVASSILICFAFFVMERLCLALGAGGHLPPWLAAWLPNALFAILGIAMTLRIR